jgi:Coenzyme PQQ synthesis protein D (PqqD)
MIANPKTKTSKPFDSDSQSSHHRTTDIDRHIRRTDIDCHTIDSEAILYDATHNVTVRLNATALTIWNMCDGQSDVSQIVNQILRTYDVTPDQAESDVRVTLASMNQNGLFQSQTNQPS